MRVSYISICIPCDPITLTVLTFYVYEPKSLNYKTDQWRIQDFPNGGALFCRKWGGPRVMKLKEIGLDYKIDLNSISEINIGTYIK